MNLESLDWSGTPLRANPSFGNSLYVPAIVVFPDDEFPEANAKRIKAKYSLPASRELKGHDLWKNYELIEDALEVVDRSCKIATAIFDKLVIERVCGPQVFDKPERMPVASAIFLLTTIADNMQMTRLLVDLGDVSSALRGSFNSTVRSISEGGITSRKMRNGYPKHVPSHKWAAIQFADLVAYAFSRFAQGKLETDRQKQLIRSLMKNSGNTIIDGGENDLRLYL